MFVLLPPQAFQKQPRHHAAAEVEGQRTVAARQLLGVPLFKASRLLRTVWIMPSAPGSAIIMDHNIAWCENHFVQNVHEISMSQNLMLNLRPCNRSTRQSNVSVNSGVNAGVAGEIISSFFGCAGRSGDSTVPACTPGCWPRRARSGPPRGQGVGPPPTTAVDCRPRPAAPGRVHAS